MTHAIEAIQYGHVVSTDLSFDRAIERVISLLKDEGFGVLCDIDVEKTMHEKLGNEFRPYRILGACNPKLAYEALSSSAQLGLLLPCNVVVQVEAGKTIVSAINTRALLSIASDPSLLPIADEVNAKLLRVLENVAGAR
ncbi:MAG: DUF302 domain-containing protein [Vulcanimicrobiaceae bacterium]